MVTNTQRNHMWRLCVLLNEYAELVNWAEVRPMSTARLTETQLRQRFLAHLMITMDCDESVTLISRLSGLRDPNGLGYDGEGWTKSLLDHLPHFSDFNRAHVGTMIVIGRYPGEHVCMLTKRNDADPSNPNVYSHGSHAKSAIWDLHTELTYHQDKTVTLLAIEDL